MPPNIHQCDIKHDSTSCLPKLPPYAGATRRWWRTVRKHFLVSEYNSYTKYHFRSQAAVMWEKRRQCYSYPVYVIHPFSNFVIYKEVVMFFLWAAVLILSPMSVTFLYNNSSIWLMSPIAAINFVLDALLVINIGLCFISGYHKPQTKETILDPKQIAKNYLKTYFICDIVEALPLKYLLPPVLIENQTCIFILFVKHFFIYPRSITMFKYFRQITLFFKIGDAHHETICVILFSFFLLHWSSCILYILRDLQMMFELNPQTWLDEAGLGPGSKQPMGVKYTWCLHMAMTHFYRTGYGLYPTDSIEDYIALSAIMIIGTVYYAYVIVVVLQVVGTANSSEIKFDALITQLYDYMRSIKMPFHITKRLRLYYECRFQNRYFREQYILSTLSEHLRSEIKLHTCKHLLGKVELFRGLSKGLIGCIVGDLILDVFLTNDVILNCEVPTEYLYIISYGTVAAIHKSGAEICHWEDGEYFGEAALLGYSNSVNIVAIETCEIFRLASEKFMKYMNNPHISTKILAVINRRIQVTKESIARYAARNYEREEVLHKVGDGKIIEGGRQRRLDL